MASEGLAGIVVGKSAISTVGLGFGLNYRGYNIIDLSKHCIFEEVAYLILFGSLPNQEQLNTFLKEVASHRTIPASLLKVLELIPKEAHPMDVLRTVSSFLGTIELETKNNCQKKISVRMLGIFPVTLLYWYHFVHNNVRIQTQTGINDTIAENFLKLMHRTDKVDPRMNRCFDVSLILYAEHDFNASTFAARVTISTLSDFYSGITSAIGTLRGPLHGGANEAVMVYLEKLNSIEQADKWLNESYKNKELVMGFGHRVYKNGDPRSDIIKEQAKQLKDLKPFGKATMYQISEHIERRVVTEKKIFPNLDFYSACAYNFCGIPTELFTPIFVCSRVTGWAAHIFEQRSANKLYRPNSHYIGPEKLQYVHMKDRQNQQKPKL